MPPQKLARVNTRRVNPSAERHMWAFKKKLFKFILFISVFSYLFFPQTKKQNKTLLGFLWLQDIEREILHQGTKFQTNFSTGKDLPLFKGLPLLLLLKP